MPDDVRHAHTPAVVSCIYLLCGLLGRACRKRPAHPRLNSCRVPLPNAAPQKNKKLDKTVKKAQSFPTRKFALKA